MGLFINILVNFIRVTLIYTRPLSNKILDVICRIFMGGTRPLPPIDSKILLMSATELAEKIRKKQLSAEEVMLTYIARMKDVQPSINAYIDERFEEAIADAKAVDTLINSGEKTEEELAVETPLLGVPFSCKEIIGVKNLSQINGMAKFKDRKAPEDGEAVIQYRKAGAIPVVVTNIPAMLLWWETENHVFGRTRNPYNNNRAVGGSSGGEGALITSAGAVIGIGNDLGGSIRIPSAFCGIYGHKPSRGIISNKSAWAYDNEALDQFQTTGPMCRYASDLHLLVKVMSGDAQTNLRLDEKVDFKNVKIYYMETLPGMPTTPDIRAAVRKATKHFEEEYNVTATELKIEELEHAFLIWQCKSFEAAGTFLSDAIADENGKVHLFREFLKCLVGCSEYNYRILYFASVEIREKDKTVERCLEMYKNIEDKLEEVLNGDAILILPTHPEPPPHPIVTIPKFYNIGYTAIFNILGYPATQIPTGFSEGVPIGIQAVATKDKDRLTLAAAVELDKVFNGWRSPCPITV